MKVSWKVGNGPLNKWLNFGADSDPDPYLDTATTCLGGGMQCPSSFSFECDRARRTQTVSSVTSSRLMDKITTGNNLCLHWMI